MPSALAKDGTANGFKMPRSTKTLARPAWFTAAPVGAVGDSMAMRHTPLGPTSSSSSSDSAHSFGSTSTFNCAPVAKFPTTGFGTLAASPSNPFASTSRPSMSAGKHRLSPSPSPAKDEDFVMISPIHHVPHLSPQSRHIHSSSPIEESPTPACGMANAAARLRLADEESPIRPSPGGMRMGCPPSPLKLIHANTLIPARDGESSPGYAMDDSPIPQPLFPLPRSHSQELRSSRGLMFAPSKPVRSGAGEETKIPRLSTSHPLRARASTGSQMERDNTLLHTSGQKKAISLDRIQSAMSTPDEAFGSIAAPPSALGHARRTSKGGLGPNRHKRINSGDIAVTASMSRSAGHKSGLALSLGGLPDFSYSNSSLSTLSTNTPPISAFSPNEPPIFEDAKPLQEAFEQPLAALRKFKPRDSGVSVGEELKPPSSVLRPSAGARPRRPPMLKRTSSMGDQRPLETPIEPAHTSGWPGVGAFNFLGEGGLPLAMRVEEEKMEMPGTPVKRGHGLGRKGMGHSSSQPSLGSGSGSGFGGVTMGSFGQGGDKGKAKVPPPTMRKKSGTMGTLPHLTLTGAGGQSSSPERDGEGSPTVMLGHIKPGAKSPMALGSGSEKGKGRLGLLGRTNSGSESDGTPTKGGGEKVALAAGRPDLSAHAQAGTPSKPPSSMRDPTLSSATGGGGGTSGIYPRLSLPAFANPKIHRTLHHRQSHPATKIAEEENVFEQRFILLETLGKGAFSTVVKVQERHGEGLWAVKKARGVFDGVRDRLRHLEEVDILRHLSHPPSAHVIRFASAWEQSRQLFIQTELCLGTLAFFLEEYGRVVERLDEGRVWKIVRELSDGVHHIHGAGVVHFDLKPANILISDVGTLKIGDFGMASRVPRVSPGEILRGAGLGGSDGLGMGGAGGGGQGWEKLEREGDRVYMPPEMLRGVFGMPADVFSFGLIILEVSTNICVPDGGPAWHSLRTDDFSVVDLSPLSPALADLITHCMAADPTARPTSGDIVGHPVITRARTGGAALAPESKEWLSGVLGGFGYALGMGEGEEEGDVEMME